MHESLGERIQGLRTARRLTQKALAKAAGINQSTLSRWEDGEGEPGASELQRLAKALRVNLHYLITGEGSEAPGEAPGRGLSVRGILRLMRKRIDELEATSGELAEGAEEAVEEIDRARAAYRRRPPAKDPAPRKRRES